MLASVSVCEEEEGEGGSRRGGKKRVGGRKRGKEMLFIALQSNNLNKAHDNRIHSSTSCFTSILAAIVSYSAHLFAVG